MSSIHATPGADAGRNEWDGIEPSFADGTIKIDAAVLNSARVELAKIAVDRAAVAERERELLKLLTTAGHSRFAIRFMRRLETMDPDDRADLLAEIDVICAYLKFW